MRRPLLRAPKSAARAAWIPCVNASAASSVPAEEPDVHRSAYERTASQHSENSAASAAS